MWLRCYARVIYQIVTRKWGLQLLVLVGSCAGNAVSRIQYDQYTWSKDLVMVQLISIATVRDLNGFLDSVLAVSVRVWRTWTTRCCDSLGSIVLIVSTYP